ncbi:MAG: hypothetical protein QG567_2503 [Campylobacterota bacterium]|nr:hypothetical protein [Campylobacterota bacterium]
MEIQDKVKALVEKGFQSRISNFLDSLGIESKLSKVLQEKLDKIGDTPVSEPTIYEALQKDKMELALTLFDKDELVTKYTAREIGDFLYAVEQKITSIKNNEGVFKSTPNTENCQLPNFIEVDELMKLGRKDAELRAKLKDAKTDKEKTKIIDDIAKTSKATEEKAYEISGLDVATLTDWEKILVVSTVYTSAIDANLSAMGRSLGNL